jgi:type IV pilus assembly protein PilV
VNFGRHSGGRRARGSALVEVLVSVLLFSIGIVALVRLLGTAVKDTGEIEYRAQATAIADEQIGRMWVDRGNLADYEVDAAALAELPGGTRTVDVNGNVVSVTIGWQAPGGPRRNHVVVATLAGN